MSFEDLVALAWKRRANAEASARFRARNPELCRARVRASKLKAKKRRARV